MQCTAKAHRTGVQCRRRAVEGMKVCQVHGGATPCGLASPHYKTGRYSKVLPARLAARYEEARQDAALLELREEIGLIDARLSELLTRADTGDAREVWDKLRTTFADLRGAMRRKDMASIEGGLTALNQIITQGGTDYAVWDEIGKTVEQRRRLVESERRRLVEMQQMITSAQAMTLVAALLASVKAHVTDRDALVNIQNDFIRLTSKESDVIDVTPE